MHHQRLISLQKGEEPQPIQTRSAFNAPSSPKKAPAKTEEPKEETKPKEEILNQATERMNKLLEKQKKQKEQQQQSSAPSADLILQGTTNKKDSLLYNNLIQETIKDSTSTNKIQ